MPFKDPQKKREYETKRRAKNRSSINAQKRKHYVENKADCLARNRKYQESHRDEILQQRKVYRQNNAVLISERGKQYYLNNERVIKQIQTKCRLDLKREVLSYYSTGTNPICSLCTENRLGALQIDHCDGGGNKHRQNLRAFGTTFYRWLKKNNFPSGYRTLCANCNHLEFLHNCQLSQHPRAIESRKRYRKIKESLFVILGDCVDCGKDDLRVLTVHHVDNDGGQHRTIIGGNSEKMYKALIKDYSLVKSLCFSCHFVRHVK